MEIKTYKIVIELEMSGLTEKDALRNLGSDIALGQVDLTENAEITEIKRDNETHTR